MTTWRVLKQVPPEHDEPSSKTWAEVGTHESEHAYWIGSNAPEEIGAYHGPGEFLLLSPDDRYKTISIGARREFYEILPDEDTDEPEPVSLEAAPSAEEVMAREG